ncbi:MAG: hypothetical protein ACM359_07425 [Bacillota bacterium]
MQANLGLIPGLAMLLTGAVLLWRGARGRRIDDHPICRVCGFDLFGLPPESHRCSECGVDLRKRRTIRIGHHQPARMVMALGMLLLFAGGGWLGIASKVASKQLNVNQYKPVWWLLREANSSSVSTRDTALKQLFTRLDKKKLSDAQVQQIVQRALQVQGDKNRPWATGWGDFVEWAQSKDRLPSEQWEQYVKQALTAFRLEARPNVRRGTTLPLRLAYGPARVGRNVTAFFVRCQRKQVLVSGMPRDPNQGDHAFRVVVLGSNRSGRSCWTVPLDDSVFAKLQNGPQTAQVSFDVEVSWGGSSRYQTELHLDAKWELVDEATVKVVTDDSLRPAVEQSLKLKAENWAFGVPRPGCVDLTMTCANPPVGLAYDVLARQGDKEWKMGIAAFKARESDDCYIGSQLSGVRGEVLDLILRPSLQAAESQVDCTEMWNGEITLRQVQVKGLN